MKRSFTSNEELLELLQIVGRIDAQSDRLSRRVVLQHARKTLGTRLYTVEEALSMLRPTRPLGGVRGERVGLAAIESESRLGMVSKRKGRIRRR